MAGVTDGVLPEGWAEASIESVISSDGLISDGDWVESKDQDPQGDVRLIQLADIGDGLFRDKSSRFMTPQSAELLNCTYLKTGDVLIARMPDPLGRACIFPKINQQAVTVVDVCLIRVGSSSAMLSELLAKWINSPSFRSLIAENASGTTRKRITRKKLEKFSIPVPPIAEQKVIAEKLDSLLAQVESTKARLEGLPEILKRFRQSVLAAAVSGKLTEEWRNDLSETAEEDLKVEIGFKDVKTKKMEPTTEHRLVTDLFPNRWAVSNFNTLYRFIDYRGKTPKKSPNGKRLYTAKNIKMGYVVNEPVEFLSNEDFQHWMTRGFTREGDIFFVTEGHTMGCVAINDIGSDIALAQRTLTLQKYGTLHSKFHLYYMLSDAFQRLVELNATGSAAKGIKAAKFRSLPLPFPSYREQTEIVRRVEELFAYADKIQQQADAALQRVNSLTQSILAKAFRGELTADWRAANPELISGENSAEALLEKIKAERAAQKPKKKTRAKKT